MVVVVPQHGLPDHDEQPDDDDADRRQGVEDVRRPHHADRMSRRDTKYVTPSCSLLIVSTSFHHPLKAP